ncbi:MAG TPA: hypothetical protein VHM89_15010, partial [Acidimicrobiales bacterium]|nr:hypothetical protein [Acidimicrobiales bacterium]
MPLDDDLRRLAGVQYSVVSREQARGLGATTTALRNRLAGPDWDAPTGRVMRLTGSSHSIRQALMTAVLDAGPGTVVSHGSAAALWRLPGFAFGDVEVSRQAPASGLEARFARLLAEAGGAPLEAQVDVGGHEWVGRVDFLDRSLG